MATSDVEEEQDRSASPAESGTEGVETAGEPSVKEETIKSTSGPSTNAKDPSRPRRKKARRACYACQRAHLTCGDERPCQRCIKRGLQDVCQDGVRKKAKYLHDAPNEALLPGAASRYSQAEVKRRRSDSNTHSESTPTTSFFPPATPYPTYNNAHQMPPPSISDRNSIGAASYGQISPSTPGFGMMSQRPLTSPTIAVDRPPRALSNPGWDHTLFDAPDPSMFNFDLASMNFGNHYGALEFGMLGHMAIGAGETPDSESATQRGSVSHYNGAMGSFSEGSAPQYSYGNDGMMTGDWTNGAGAMYGSIPHKDGPHAYAIETAAGHVTTSEATSTPPDMHKYENSPVMATPNRILSGPEAQKYAEYGAAPSHTSPRAATHISTPQLKAKSLQALKPNRRLRDPTTIYTSVTSPYPYTAGFHQFVAYLQQRFQNAPAKTLAIAKSLASIRPSFIATNKTLTREDLIFMEKCFQRTLWEYEGFIEGIGTPTIIARRTGEIAAVGKEFQILTGWSKNVLLGKAPNLNVNRGHSDKTLGESGANSTGRVTGVTTPSLKIGEDASEPRLQPVFLAELLDDDSVVQFYEDFARLAFTESRGTVMGRGKLLKYRTRDDEIEATLKAEAESQGDGEKPDPKRQDSFARALPQAAKKGISGEKGMQKLGSSDGKVDCTYCWTVKRDVFDIPMLIVMNFLPCI